MCVYVLEILQTLFCSYRFLDLCLRSYAHVLDAHVEFTNGLFLHTLSANEAWPFPNSATLGFLSWKAIDVFLCLYLSGFCDID